MKKIIVFIMVLFIAIVACKPKQKPDNRPGIGGDKPPVVSIGSNELAILNTIEKNFSSGTFISNAAWSNPNYLIKEENPFSQGFLIGNLQGHWVVLGFSTTGEVLLGEGGSGKLQDAINMAGDSKNWDPRKIIYYFSDVPTEKSAKLAWSGRVGGASGDGSALTKYTDYDIYKTPLHRQSTYTIYTKYDVVFFRALGLAGEVLNAERNALSRGWDSWASYIIEQAPQGEVTSGRKAWLYNFDLSHGKPGTDIIVVKPEGIRFGYLTNNSVASVNYYLSGFGPTKNSSLIAATNTTIARVQNNSAPTGKTVFRRTGPNGSWVVFLTTVVGYNIREKEHEDVAIVDGTDNLRGSYDEVKDVIMEFDAATYADARSDGWDDFRDIPSKGNAGFEIGASSGTTTFKVPFVFVRNDEE